MTIEELLHLAEKAKETEGDSNHNIYCSDGNLAILNTFTPDVLIQLLTCLKELLEKEPTEMENCCGYCGYYLPGDGHANDCVWELGQSFLTVGNQS